MAAPESGNKAIVVALGVNTSLAVAKFVGFVITGSASMLAESIHSVADSGNQVLLLLGSKRADREQTERRQFGHGREHYVGAFVVAIVVFLLASLYVLNDGLEAIVNRDGGQLSRPWLAVAILVLALLVQGASLRGAIMQSNEVRGAANWRQFVMRFRLPEMPMVLVAHMAAMIGLVVALIGVAVSAVTGNSMWDGISTVLVGTLLGVMAVVSAEQLKSLLIGESATVADQERIVAAIESSPSVRSLVHMRTQNIGPGELFVAAKVEFEQNMSAAGLASTINGVQERIRAAVPAADPIYIEPDVRTHF